MNKTLRELLERMEPEEIERVGGACVWETKGQYEDAWSQMLGWLRPLLDATVIGLCETCGGSRKVLVPAAETDEFYAAFGKKTGEVVMKEAPCPDCTGTVSVVTKELREQAMVAGCAESAKCRRCTYDAPDCPWAQAAVDAALSTVLGKTRVAKETGVVQPLIAPVTVETERGPILLKAGSTIATLEDDDE